MLNKIFFAVPDGQGLFCELLPLRTGGLPVCATAARIATHAHAMPCATQPAVTRASPIPFGCRVLDGQVISGEHLRDGGLLAGRVAVERSESLSLAVTSLFESEEPAQTVRYLRTSILCSFAWDGTHEHGRDRAGSSGAGPIFRAWTGHPACGNQYMYNVECVEARRGGPRFAVQRI